MTRDGDREGYGADQYQSSAHGRGLPGTPRRASHPGGGAQPAAQVG